jgi:hypothetical protein
MRSVVVCCDAVPLSLLGPYGSEWVETPTLDRLAAEGAVFDNVWLVEHRGVRPCDAGGPGDGTIQRFLLSDRSARRDDGQWVFVEPSGDGCEAVFEKGAELWDVCDEQSAFWIEVAMAEAEWTVPPDWNGRHLEDAEENPSEKERLAAGWADRIAYFDSVLQAFIQSIEAESSMRPLIAFTAASGWPLGEHSGAAADRHREWLQLPLIVRHPKGPRSVRRNTLLTAADASAMLAELTSGRSAASLARPVESERWVVSDESQITTRHWRYVERPEGEPMLFALPEDVHEMNDLAGRTPGVVENFQAAIRERG